MTRRPGASLDTLHGPTRTPLRMRSPGSSRPDMCDRGILRNSRRITTRMTMNRRRIPGVFVLTVLGLVVISGSAIAQQKMLNEQLATAPTPEIRQALAPSGKLRVGVYPGSPFSMVRDPVSGEMKGIAVELGKALAMRLGVAYEQVEFRRPGEIYEALKVGQVDMT